MTTRSATIAVLTGDIIGSTDLSSSDLEHVVTAMNAEASSFIDWQLGQYGMTWSRGDTWQMVLHEPSYALRAALVLTAALGQQEDRLASRIAIGVGEATFPLPEDLNRATGPAFTASGRALDAMPNDRRIVHASGGALDACTRLADAIAQTWTAAQARTALHLLRPDSPTRADVAERFGISRQAVDKSAHGAQLPAILDALEMIEAAP